MSAIAFQGEIELLNAAWSLDSGRTVEFLLAGEQANELSINPFKVYQKRRGGKVGQRFRAVIVPLGFEVACFDDELMLAGWGDTDKGKTVRFWIDEESSLHPFAGYNKRHGKNPGQRFMAAMSLIEEDESVGQPDPEDVPQTERKHRNWTRSQEVHLIVTGRAFQIWMDQQLGIARLVEKGEPPISARDYVKSALQLSSLSELDIGEDAYNRWRERFWKPFSHWAEEREQAA